LVGAAQAQDAGGRKELKRADLTGTNMEVIVSVSETRPGEALARHFHHGEEALYVLEGATVELPDGKQITLATGSANINVRDVPHAGFKVVGPGQTEDLLLVGQQIVSKALKKRQQHVAQLIVADGSGAEHPGARADGDDELGHVLLTHCLLYTSPSPRDS